MHRPPIKITREQLPADAIYHVTLNNGEILYTHGLDVYAVQPSRR